MYNIQFSSAFSVDEPEFSLMVPVDEVCERTVFKREDIKERFTNLMSRSLRKSSGHDVDTTAPVQELCHKVVIDRKTDIQNSFTNLMSRHLRKAENELEKEDLLHNVDCTDSEVDPHGHNTTQWHDTLSLTTNEIQDGVQKFGQSDSEHHKTEQGMYQCLLNILLHIWYFILYTVMPAHLLD